MILIEDDGTISLYQGDSGEIEVNGLDTNHSYVLFFAVQNYKRVPVGSELQVSASGSSSVTFILTPQFTNLLTVPANKPYEIYYYGIKACITDPLTEDTLFIGNSTYGDLNRMIVYPKKVKGVQNAGE